MWQAGLKKTQIKRKRRERERKKKKEAQQSLSVGKLKVNYELRPSLNSLTLLIPTS